MKIVFRTDASLLIGSGHVMRCLVLANALRERGHAIRFATRPQSGDLISRIKAQGFDIVPMEQPEEWVYPESETDYRAWLQVEWQQDARDFLTKVTEADWVIIDHYGINAEWEGAVRDALGCRVMAIDDLVREHIADIVLDQTLGRCAAEYQGNSNLPFALTGTDFALVHPSFAEARAGLKPPECAANKCRILVSMGGVDQPNATLKVLQTLARSEQLSVTVTVLINPQAPHYHEVLAFCRQFPRWITQLDFAENMAEIMCDHDIAIGAPGTTSWERACVGLPSIVVPIADNQRQTATVLAKYCIAKIVELDDIESDLIPVVKELIASPDSNSSAGLIVCDGLGVRRVVAAIECQESQVSLCLRKANSHDCKQVFDWQLLPQTRRFALNPTPPSWEEHTKWMQAKLVSPDDYFYIIEKHITGEAQRGCGVVRLDRKPDGHYLISIFVDPGFYGQSVASQTLKMLDTIHPDIVIDATVLSGNEASQKLFTKAGYNRLSAEFFQRQPVSRRGN